MQELERRKPKLEISWTGPKMMGNGVCTTQGEDEDRLKRKYSLYNEERNMK